MQTFTATASHLVEFYDYTMEQTTIGEQPVITLFTDDHEIVIHDSNLKNPFENTLFIGHSDENENSFFITGIMM
jgi:hypothetical protein